MRKNAITALLIFATAVVWAQDFETRKKAYGESYSLEYSKKYAEAAEKIKSVYNASDYTDNVRLGWLLYTAAKSTDALAYYEKAIALQPSSIEARLGIVYPLSALNKWDEVIKQYQEILKVDTKHSTALYRLGYIYYYRGQFAEAKTYLSTLVQTYPFDFDGLSLMGWNELKLGNKAAAKDYFERALLNHPADTSAAEGLKLSK